MNILTWLKWLLSAVVALSILILIVVMVLPNDYSVTRNIVIGAPAEKIFPLVVTPREWKNWSAWNQRDPAMQMSFSGPASGKEATWDWKSQTQGNGGMKFIQAIPNQRIDYELHFEGIDKPSTGSFLFEAQGNSTKVSWSMKGTSEGSLMTKLFMPFMDKLIGSDFDEGLKNLKKLAEKQ